jgi:hypothetical protein
MLRDGWKGAPQDAPPRLARLLDWEHAGQAHGWFTHAQRPILVPCDESEPIPLQPDDDVVPPLEDYIPLPPIHLPHDLGDFRVAEVGYRPPIVLDVIESSFVGLATCAALNGPGDLRLRIDQGWIQGRLGVVRLADLPLAVRVRAHEQAHWLERPSKWQAGTDLEREMDSLREIHRRVRTTAELLTSNNDKNLLAHIPQDLRLDWLAHSPQWIQGLLREDKVTTNNTEHKEALPDKLPKSPDISQPPRRMVPTNNESDEELLLAAAYYITTVVKQKLFTQSQLAGALAVQLDSKQPPYWIRMGARRLAEKDLFGPGDGVGRKSTTLTPSGSEPARLAYAARWLQKSG